MEIELGIGNGTQSVTIPDHRLSGVLLPNHITLGLKGEPEVKRALLEPIGTPRLKELVHAGEKIAIVTSDVTRPMPSSQVLPALLEELEQGGVKDEDVTVVFALGSHRKQTREEMEKLVGKEFYERIRCVDSDPEDCIHLGNTGHGTPVDITRTVAQADRRICIGNIEYHYFAGYSGGAKAIMPGCSTREAIQANHSLMVNPLSCAGNLETNPLRRDVEEAAAMVGVDFIVNVVLDEHKQIIRCVAGDVTAAHRAGCRFLDGFYRIPIAQRADIVIVSQGGAPKDLNLYQTQKALDNAKHAVRDGGIIILVGSCREGLGERVFEEWMLNAPTAHSLIERIRKEFQLGGHKAAAIAMVLERADIYLVSDLEDAFVRNIFMKPYHQIQAALDDATSKLGAQANVLVMPYGGSTLPSLET